MSHTAAESLDIQDIFTEDNVFTAVTCLDTLAKVTRASNSIFPLAQPLRKLPEDTFRYSYNYIMHITVRRIS